MLPPKMNVNNKKAHKDKTNKKSRKRITRRKGPSIGINIIIPQGRK